MMLRNLAVDFRGFCEEEDDCLQAVIRGHAAHLSTVYCSNCHRQLRRADIDLGTWHMVPLTPDTRPSSDQEVAR